MDPGPLKPHPPFIGGPDGVPVELLSEGAKVHVENGGVQGLFAVLLGDDRLFGRVHAAHGRAVGVVALVDVPGAHALEPGHFLGLLVVRGPHQMALVGAGGGQHPLELQAGEDVGMVGVTIRGVGGGIKGGETGGQDDGPHLHFDDLLFLGVVHGLGQAGLDALVAFRADAALEAALGFGQGLGLVVSQGNLQKIALPGGFGVQAAHRGPGLLGLHGHVRLFMGPLFFPALAQILIVDEPVDALGRLFPGRHGLHHGFGAVDRVAAGKDPFNGGLAGDGIGFDAAGTAWFRCPGSLMGSKRALWPMAMMIVSPK